MGIEKGSKSSSGAGQVKGDSHSPSLRMSEEKNGGGGLNIIGLF